MWRSQALFVIGLALLAAFSAFPLDDPGRAAAGGCTRSARPGALQAAVDTASIGETICLEAGVYRGPVIFSRKSGVTLRGQGAATIIAGGSADGIVALDSDNLTFEDLKLFFGHPANAYVGNSRNVTFQRIDAGGGGIGIHFDNGSSGRVGESFIYAMEGDGVLIRRGSNVNVERNWIFVNGGVGVSMVGQGASASIVRNIISDNRASGVFVGQPPCAGLPPGRVEAPQCFIANPPGFVASTTVTFDTNVVQASGGTGVVLFPGTLATLRGNRFWRNRFTGLFAWGATVSSDGDQYDGNEENAAEFRAYPDPYTLGLGGSIRGSARLLRNDVHDSLALGVTGTLGGGLVAQGTQLDVAESRVYRNRGIGISFINASSGSATGNTIFENGGSAICIHSGSTVNVTGNQIYGNFDDRAGVCSARP